MFRAAIASIVMAAGFAAFVGTPTTAAAGPIGGLPQSATFDLPGEHIGTIPVELKGNEPTTVSISGNGSTSLELRVYDESGTLVASDDFGSGDKRSVTFTPSLGGKFKIKVTNPGQATNTYFIRVS